MKKIILLFLVVLCNIDVFAQKSYVRMTWYTNDGYYAFLEGDVPTNIEGLMENDKYLPNQYKYYIRSGHCELFNKLAQEGFILEIYNWNGGSANSWAVMSRDTSSASSIQHIQADVEEDGDIREVARYNLQGMPIGKHEKGVQIIVYSNYTTKTVIVE